MLWRFMLVHMRLCAQLLSRVQLLWPHGLEPASLLCPWDLPGKNTGVGCHFLFQGIFLTQGSNPSLLCPLHRQADSLPMSHLGNPLVYIILVNSFLPLYSIPLHEKYHSIFPFQWGLFPSCLFFFITNNAVVNTLVIVSLNTDARVSHGYKFRNEITRA